MLVLGLYHAGTRRPPITRHGGGMGVALRGHRGGHDRGDGEPGLRPWDPKLPSWWPMWLAGMVLLTALPEGDTVSRRDPGGAARATRRGRSWRGGSPPSSRARSSASRTPAAAGATWSCRPSPASATAGFTPRRRSLAASTRRAHGAQPAAPAVLQLYRAAPHRLDSVFQSASGTLQLCLEAAAALRGCPGRRRVVRIVLHNRNPGRSSRRSCRPGAAPVMPALRRQIDPRAGSGSMSHLALVALIVRDYRPGDRLLRRRVAVRPGGGRAVAHQRRPAQALGRGPPPGRDYRAAARPRRRRAQARSSATSSPAGSASSCASTISMPPTALTAAGVDFVTAPRAEPYGHVAVFLDLEGNRWDLLGPA